MTSVTKIETQNYKGEEILLTTQPRERILFRIKYIKQILLLNHSHQVSWMIFVFQPTQICENKNKKMQRRAEVSHNLNIKIFFTQKACCTIVLPCELQNKLVSEWKCIQICILHTYMIGIMIKCSY